MTLGYSQPICLLAFDHRGSFQHKLLGIAGAGTEERVIEWLRNGAGVPEWVGFGVGRTIWWDALVGRLAGGSVNEAVDAIAGSYGRLNAAWTETAEGAS